MKQHIHEVTNAFAAGWVIAVLTIVAAAGTAAQWVRSPGTNTPVCTASKNQLRPSIAPDGIGGAIVAWIDARSQPGTYTTSGWIAAQKFSVDGMAERETNGRMVDSTRVYASLSPIAADGYGGIFLCGIQKTTDSVILHHVTGDGISPWGMTGRPLGKGSRCALASDDANGVFAAWEDQDSVRIQRVAASGETNWTSSGLFVSRGDLCDLFSDDAGGVVVVARDSATSTILAQKVSPDGSVLWGTDGLVVGTGTNPAGISSANGGCVVAWSQPSGEQDVLFGQAISSSGTLHQMAGGIKLCPGQIPLAVKGLNGEVIVVGRCTKSKYPNPNDIYAQCLDATGNPLWSPDGVLVTQQVTTSSVAFHVAVSDNGGGAIIVWTWKSSDWQLPGLHAQRVNRAGVLQWPARGILVSGGAPPYPYPRYPEHRYLAAIGDNDHGMIIVWEDGRDDGVDGPTGLPAETNRDIYAQRIRGPGHLGIADIPPVVTSIQPTHGIVGTGVTLRGSHFSPAANENAVYLGGSRVTITDVTDSVIHFFAPIGAMYAAPTVTFGGLTAYGAIPFVSTTPGRHTITESMFDSSFGLATGGLPWSLDAGDLNGDGKQDIVTAISDRNVLAVWLNTGTMGAGQHLSFASAIELSTHPGPTGVSIADLDGDGLLDILVACEGDNTVCLFQNTSAGDTLRFAPAIAFAVGSKPKGAAASDLDGDGRPEVITPNGGGESISILLNHCDIWGITDTSFGTAIDQPVGQGPLSIVVRDIDGDLRPDIAVACDGSQSVVVLRNTSSAAHIAFASSKLYPCGGVPGRMTSGDVDGDGLSDIAVPLTNGSSVAVLRNNSGTGAISFDPAVQFETGSGAWCASFSDLDGDARVDLAVVNYNAGSISILKNTSLPGLLTAGSLSQTATLTIGGKPLHLQVSDFNGDGLADVVAADRTGERVRILKGLEPPRLPLRINSFSPSIVQVGDIVTIVGTGFSENAIENIVRVGQMPAEILSSEPTRLTVRVSSRSSTDTIRVTSLGRKAVSRRPLRVSFPTAALPDSTAFQNPTLLNPGVAADRWAFNDCDWDGRPEFFVVPGNTPLSGSPYSSALFKNTSNGRTLSFERARFPGFGMIYPEFKGPTIFWKDVDGDGRDDLIYFPHKDVTAAFVRNTSTPGDLSGDHAGRIEFGPYAGSCFLDDFNGDGKIDMLVPIYGEYGMSVDHYMLYENLSIQGWLSPESFLPISATGPGKASFAIDLDADGLPDLLDFPSLNDSTMTVYRNTSTVGVLSFASPLILPVRGVPSIDIDGDDLLDIAGSKVFRNTSQGGMISFALPTQLPVGGPATFGDFTGDGLPDFITVVGTLASVCVNTSSIGTISFGPPATFPWEGTIRAIKDLNGDGRDDVVVYRGRDSSIVILESTFGVSSAPFAQEWRIPGKHPRLDGVLDVDGDGALDILVRTAIGSSSYHTAAEWAIYRNRIRDLYTLHASSDSLGTISPGGNVHVQHGGSQLFLLTPNPGCVLDSLLVDGVRVDSTTSYTFTKVISDHTISARFAKATDVEERTHPREFSLQQNFPNPFNPSTTIKYQVPVTSQVRLVVYDLLGREVCVLLDELKVPGTYKVTWDAKGVASGVYFYMMQAGSFVGTRRSLLLR